MNSSKKIPAAFALFAALVFGTLFFASCYGGDTINCVVVNDEAPKEKNFPVTVARFKEIKRAEYYGDGSGDWLALGILEGKEDIPYVIVDENFLKVTIERDCQDWRSYTISPVSASSTKVEITNEKTKSKATFDLARRACSFDNYDSFFQNSPVYLDAASPHMDYISFADYGSVLPYSNIPGQPVTLYWSTQDIGVILARVDGGCFLSMPLQSFADIFNYPVAYNGSKLFYSMGLINGYGQQIVSDYYSTSTIQQGNRSAALAEYCYNELCLNLDFNYGLKAIHGIEAFPDFDCYFAAAGIRDDLKSVDPLKFATQLKEVCEFYFGDGHSNYCYNSSYLGKNVVVPTIHIGSAYERRARNQQYSQARSTKYGDSIPAYEVSTDGETAIVRFDHFTFSGKNAAAQRTARQQLLANGRALLNEYVNKHENDYETMALFSAVNGLIQGDDNIKNVVLDLSCNGGGANHAACFVIAWMLGYCKFDFRNPITGAKWSAAYKVDVNFDGAYNGLDTVADKNLFCLISPNSFSCGNLTPAMLKASDRVTILGTPSSGGTSCVQASCAADGTIFRFSSKNEMCYVKNGSYYDVDNGVEPHYAINIPSNFYDKEEISALVQSVNKRNNP